MNRMISFCFCPLLLLAGLVLPAPAAELPLSALRAGQLLLASKTMGDERFRETVILILTHGPQGSQGIILNKPTTWPLSHAFPSLKEKLAPFDQLYYGGPVAPFEPTVMLQSLTPPPGAAPLLGDIYKVGVRFALERLLSSESSGDQPRFYLGYAGWAPGQLEAEINRGGWKLIEGKASAVFSDEPANLWRQLLPPELIEVRTLREQGISAG